MCLPQPGLLGTGLVTETKTEAASFSTTEKLLLLRLQACLGALKGPWAGSPGA